MEPARGRGRRHAGEEVNRFLAWELCPCREISELSLGQAHSPRALAWLGQRGLYLLSGAFFLLWFPHPTRHPRRGHSKDHSLALSRETAAQPPCPGCLSPTAALPGEDPKLHFAEEESDVWLLDRWLQEGLDAALSRCSVRAN